MKSDAEIRLEIVSLFYQPGRKPWKEVVDEAQDIYSWVTQGTRGDGPASANAAPTSGDTVESGPGATPGQAAPPKSSRNNPLGRA